MSGREYFPLLTKHEIHLQLMVLNEMTAWRCNFWRCSIVKICFKNSNINSSTHGFKWNDDLKVQFLKVLYCQNLF